ncbi:porin [Trinickia caryophylli]|uniref:Outer membrane protein (Porin) n=1 Tax=Trinickia caryophylli TaxID=28094 RepID=A0A1X7FTM6_TRICW|nr:porin [Trinickia caryophylli]PMS11904.1 porin [Trinickia caryophylli]TRX14019.1 porin [Trinickia caryophylli]WQE15616.1 porin [Trinickia caryophylli]SMF58558.1 Outer membrane protein (porin) [Trinickia caryophylli]GLU33620.1 membrane protein [Trinickia caryophylli]
MQAATTRLALCGALCALTTSAYAQSSVTLYGIVDTGIEYVSHANAAGDRVIRMPAVTGEFPSRWGLRGTEDLGGGYSAVFTLESGFNMRDGSSGQGGRLFGRQAFVGLKSTTYGTLAFGRQYAMTYLAIQGADIIGPDIYGMGSLDAYIPNARTDNAVTYLGSYKGFTLGLGYSFGRDSAGTGNSPGQGTCAGSVPGHATECRDWSVMLKYDSQYFGVAASYEEERGGTNAAANFFDGVTPTVLTSAADKDARAHLSAYAQYAGAKIGAGWVGRRVVTQSPAVPDVRSNLFFVGASYLVLPTLVVDGEVYRIVNSEHDTRATMGTLRTTYLLSKRSSVYAQVAYLANSAKARYAVSGGGSGTTPGAGMGQTGVMVGIKHMF